MGKRLLGNPRFRLRSRSALARENRELRVELDLAKQRIRQLERDSGGMFRPYEQPAPDPDPASQWGTVGLFPRQTGRATAEKIYVSLIDLGFSSKVPAADAFTLRLLVSEGFTPDEIETCAREALGRGGNTVRYLAMLLRARRREQQQRLDAEAERMKTRFELEPLDRSSQLAAGAMSATSVQAILNRSEPGRAEPPSDECGASAEPVKDPYSSLNEIVNAQNECARHWRRFWKIPLRIWSWLIYRRLVATGFPDSSPKDDIAIIFRLALDGFSVSEIYQSANDVLRLAAAQNEPPSGELLERFARRHRLEGAARAAKARRAELAKVYAEAFSRDSYDRVKQEVAALEASRPWFVRMRLALQRLLRRRETSAPRSRSPARGADQ